MSFEKVEMLLKLHQEWLDSSGRSGQCATYLGKRIPTPNFFTEDNRQVFVPWLAPKDDLVFTEDDLRTLRSSHNYPLPPLNLEKSDFRGADFEFADLRQANFTGANLQKSIFKNALLDSTNFKSAQLSEANFSECSIRHVNFDSASLESARFFRIECFDSSMHESDLDGSFIEDSIFDNVNMDGSKLRGCNIARVNFDNVNLQNTILLRSSIDDCRFRNARLQGMIAPYLCTRGSTFQELQVSGSQFYLCLFENCEFDKCDMNHVNYSGSVFKGVNMHHSNLGSAYFQGAFLERVSFDSSDLSFADFSDLSLIVKIWIGNKKETEEIHPLEKSLDSVPSVQNSSLDRMQNIIDKKYAHVPEIYVTTFQDTSWLYCDIFKMRITATALASIADEHMQKAKWHLDIIKEGKKPRKCRVFLCYAREDEAIVTEFYIGLKNQEDMDPWMDRRKLRVGQKWDDIINKAIKRTDVFIMFLSNHSVSKRGYIQKEYRMALEICSEIPDDDIFILPVKLDNCSVPDRLTPFQWVEYNVKANKEAFVELLASIRSQFKKIADRENL